MRIVEAHWRLAYGASDAASGGTDRDDDARFVLGEASTLPGFERDEVTRLLGRLAGRHLGWLCYLAIRVVARDRARSDARPWALGRGRRDPSLAAWLAGIRDVGGDVARLRKRLDHDVGVARGERAIGVRVAMRLELADDVLRLLGTLPVPVAVSVATEGRGGTVLTRSTIERRLRLRASTAGSSASIPSPGYSAAW